MIAGTKKAFTIVELLVVITIIGLLMALLLPAVNSARRTAREAECISNQRSIGQAMYTHATKKDYFPGRLSLLVTDSGQQLQASWFVRLLPYLDRNDLYDAIKTGIDSGPGTFLSSTYLDLAVCPSDPPPTLADPHLSYVANTGVWDPSLSWRDLPANGICHNLFARSDSMSEKQLANKAKVTLSYVSKHDGASTTLLLSENVDARLWFSKNSPNEGDTGIVWTENLDAQLGINKDVGFGPNEMNFKYARPSSRHTGIVVATFCDAHTVRLNEEIDRKVYAQLMTPFGKGSRPGPNAKDSASFSARHAVRRRSAIVNVSLVLSGNKCENGFDMAIES